MSITNTNKHDGDLWRTPKAVRDGVLSLLKSNETKLLDPCVGRGDLCDFEKYDYKCYDIQKLVGQPDGTHIKSFLETTTEDNADNRVVVMNPPFSIGRDFVEHALHIADTVIGTGTTYFHVNEAELMDKCQWDSGWVNLGKEETTWRKLSH